MGAKAAMTIEEFAQLRTAETEDYELVDGELIPLSSGTPKHSIVRDWLGDILRTYFRAQRNGRCLAEVDCRILDMVRRPDLSIFLGDRLHEINLDKTPIPFAPDIAVEVLSPSESAIDVHRKVRDYLRAGTQEVWILDYDNGELHVCTGRGIRRLLLEDTLDSPLLPDFQTSLAGLLSGF